MHGLLSKWVDLSNVNNAKSHHRDIYRCQPVYVTSLSGKVAQNQQSECFTTTQPTSTWCWMDSPDLSGWTNGAMGSRLEGVCDDLDVYPAKLRSTEAQITLLADSACVWLFKDTVWNRCNCYVHRFVQCSASLLWCTRSSRLYRSNPFQ